MYKDIYPESKLDWLFYYIEAKFKFQLIFLLFILNIMNNECYKFCNQKFSAFDSKRTFCKKACDSDEPNM